MCVCDINSKDCDQSPDMSDLKNLINKALEKQQCDSIHLKQ